MLLNCEQNVSDNNKTKYNTVKMLFVSRIRQIQSGLDLNTKYHVSWQGQNQLDDLCELFI